MLDGLYKGASALDMLTRQQETVAANIAHLNTPGYRRSVFSFAQTSDTQLSGQSAAKPSIDFNDGRLESTGRKLDLALRGDGFFVFESSDGKLYSRNGVLALNPENKQLVNLDGLPIVGEGGPITVDGDLSELTVAADGTISLGQQQLGKLSIVQFKDNRMLQTDGQIYFEAGRAQAVPAEDAQVFQGFRELSNAHAMTEMISLIVGSRHFEASQRAMRMISDTMELAAKN